MKTRNACALLFALGVLLACADRAFSQVQLPPGEALRHCNTLDANTMSGITCNHYPDRQAVFLTYHDQNWHRIFWGDGSAPAILPRLCIDLQVEVVVEIIYETPQGRMKKRVIPCSTGKSRSWVILPLEEKGEKP